MQLDDYVITVLMRDLVNHDNQPSAFIVLLYIYYHWSTGGEAPVKLSLSRIADGTGLSKSAVQNALRLLKHRQLLQVAKVYETATPEYTLLPHWQR